MKRFFFNPNLIIFFSFGGGGGEGLARVSDFFTKNPNLKYNIFWGGVVGVGGGW